MGGTRVINKKNRDGRVEGHAIQSQDSVQKGRRLVIRQKAKSQAWECLLLLFCFAWVRYEAGFWGTFHSTAFVHKVFLRKRTPLVYVSLWVLTELHSTVLVVFLLFVSPHNKHLWPLVSNLRGITWTKNEYLFVISVMIALSSAVMPMNYSPSNWTFCPKGKRP